MKLITFTLVIYLLQNNIITNKSPDIADSIKDLLSNNQPEPTNNPYTSTLTRDEYVKRPIQTITNPYQYITSQYQQAYRYNPIMYSTAGFNQPSYNLNNKLYYDSYINEFRLPKDSI
jgi:hypothetical protein